MLEKLHILIALIAAVAVTILGLYQEITFFDLTERLVIIIPIFYIFGLILRHYLKKLLIPPEVSGTDGKEEPGSAQDAGELDDLALYDLENSKDDDADGLDSFSAHGQDINNF